MGCCNIKDENFKANSFDIEDLNETRKKRIKIYNENKEKNDILVTRSIIGSIVINGDDLEEINEGIKNSSNFNKNGFILDEINKRNEGLKKVKRNENLKRVKVDEGNDDEDEDDNNKEGETIIEEENDQIFIENKNDKFETPNDENINNNGVDFSKNNTSDTPFGSNNLNTTTNNNKNTNNNTNNHRLTINVNVGRKKNKSKQPSQVLKNNQSIGLLMTTRRNLRREMLLDSPNHASQTDLKTTSLATAKNSKLKRDQNPFNLNASTSSPNKKPILNDSISKKKDKNRVIPPLKKKEDKETILKKFKEQHEKDFDKILQIHSSRKNQPDLSSKQSSKAFNEDIFSDYSKARAYSVFTSLHDISTVRNNNVKFKRDKYNVEGDITNIFS